MFDYVDTNSTEYYLRQEVCRKIKIELEKTNPDWEYIDKLKSILSNLKGE